MCIKIIKTIAFTYIPSTKETYKDIRDALTIAGVKSGDRIYETSRGSYKIINTNRIDTIIDELKKKHEVELITKNQARLYSLGGLEY